jgi:NAD(P)-dependent dehydrogenase (short-subunit alcohol dehydrogenase family)
VSHPFSYENKRVVVTGGSSGVGHALVGVLRQLDVAHVTVIDVRDPDVAVDRFVRADLSDQSAVQAIPAALDGAIDVLFNNAGVAATRPAKMVMSVNYLGLRRLSETLLDRIPAGGAIVNTSSTTGNRWAAHLAEISELLDLDDWDESLAWVHAHPELTADPYSFSKECVQVYTQRSSRSTTARGVRTNSVAAGPIDTPLMVDFRATMTDKVIDWSVGQTHRGLASAGEIAAVLAFLGTEAAINISGVNVLADGGFTAALEFGQVDFSGLS